MAPRFGCRLIDHAVDSVAVDSLVEHAHRISGAIFLEPDADEVVDVQGLARRERGVMLRGDAGIRGRFVKHALRADISEAPRELRVVGSVIENLHVAVDRRRRHGARAVERLGRIGHAAGPRPVHVHPRSDLHGRVAEVRDLEADDRRAAVGRRDIGDARPDAALFHRASRKPVIAKAPAEARERLPHATDAEERLHQRLPGRSCKLDQPAVAHRDDVEVHQRAVARADRRQRDPVVSGRDDIVGCEGKVRFGSCRACC